VEYNVVQWGTTPWKLEGGVPVHVRAQAGKLRVARIYDDTDPPPAH
jgi:hypothetical protein